MELRVLYYVNPDDVTVDTYKLIGKQLHKEFDVYGSVDNLSITDCLIMTSDPDILINEQVEPDLQFIHIELPKEQSVDLEELDKTKPLWEDAEEFFNTVLFNDISQKTDNNYHFIQVSILDLAKYGFKHPQHDLSFVIDLSESVFKVSSSNKTRLLEASEMVKNKPQSLWPYKLGQAEDEGWDEPYDYSDYSDVVVTKKKTKAESKSEKDDDEEDDDGMVELSTFFDKVIDQINEGDSVGFRGSFVEFSNNFRLKGTGILTVTGIPGHGKTEFVDAMVLDMARLYGHSTIMVGFEQSPQEHIVKLLRKMIGADITCPTWLSEDGRPKLLRQAFDWITSKIHHVDVNRVGGNLEKLLSKCASKIHKLRTEGQDPKYVVIDPFNMLSIKARVMGHEKAEEILRQITHFSHQMGVLVFLVAHPFKMKKNEKTGEYDVPDFYSVKGSSAFFEMSYHGLTIYRRPDGLVMVKVLKVKQNNLGNRESETFFTYRRDSGRYVPVDEQANEQAGDHRDFDWLEKAIQVENNLKNRSRVAINRVPLSNNKNNN